MGEEPKQEQEVVPQDIVEQRVLRESALTVIVQSAELVAAGVAGAVGGKIVDAGVNAVSQVVKRPPQDPPAAK